MATSKPAAASDAKTKAATSKKSSESRRFRVSGWGIARFALTSAVWAFVAALFLLGAIAYTLPPVDGANAVSRKPSIEVRSADGVQLASFGEIYGQDVQLEGLPAYVPAAVIAIEDRRFYEHSGLDWRGLARAMVANAKAGRWVQGGSTLTQQVAKNLFLSNDRTLWRKGQELLLSLWLERRFTKDEILTLYLNRVYLGSGTFGYEAAARRYFGRSAENITLHQAAVMAGMLKAPSRLNPIADRDAANNRARLVLRAMVETGVISDRQASQARETGASSQAAQSAGARPGRHFTDWVMAQLNSYLGPVDRDVVIYTTLDTKLQRSAEQGLSRLLATSGQSRRIGDGAVVVMSTDGAVRAMVGGRNYSKSQFNRATQAKRQPGSAFKPIVYLAALEAGFTPEDILEDAPVTIDGWRPSNFDKAYKGDVTLTEAMAQSINTVAVKVTRNTGLARVQQTATRLGLGGDLPQDLSVALGTAETTLLDLTAAYGPFAAGGTPIWPFGIDVIEDRDGTVLYRRDGSGAAVVVNPTMVAQMNTMLSAVLTDGTGKAALLDRPAAGKTGTSQDYRDAWFVGYSADYVAGVWMGNDNGIGMAGVTGGSLPAQLWADVMRTAHVGLPHRPLPGNYDVDSGPVARFWQRLVGGG